MSRPNSSKCMDLLKSLPCQPAQVFVLNVSGGRLDLEFSHHQALHKYSDMNIVLMDKKRTAFLLGIGECSLHRLPVSGSQLRNPPQKGNHGQRQDQGAQVRPCQAGDKHHGPGQHFQHTKGTWSSSPPAALSLGLGLAAPTPVTTPATYSKQDPFI